MADDPGSTPVTDTAAFVIWISNVSPQQFAEAQRITEIVCVQNFYNVAYRTDDGIIDGSRAISN